MTTYDLDFQICLFDRFAQQANMASIAFQHRWGPQIIAMARPRLIDGYDMYGDEMFQQGNAELWRETAEEAADKLNRRVVRIARDAGVLPWRS